MGIKPIASGYEKGERIYDYIIENGSDTRIVITNLGGIIKSIFTKDKNGRYTDIVAGFDTPKGYLSASGYFGAIVGRVANRLNNAKFTLDGEEYQLYANDGKHQLHGGKEGFDRRIWDADDGHCDEEPELILTYHSTDGEEYYPGNLDVTVTYKLKKDGALSISYKATTDRPTVVSMTSHSYFNLGGLDSGTVDDYIITVDADRIIETDRDLIPTGRLCEVAGTPYDLRKPTRVGDSFTSDDPMLTYLGGYDTCYMLSSKSGSLRKVAELYDPKSGRYIEVETDQPCIQVYTGNMIVEDGPAFKGGVKQYKHCAVCLETEKMIDSPNHDGFSDITLRPGEVYTHETVYRFGAK